MSSVTIAGNNYPVYADIAFAGQYLAGDASRSSPWAALTDDQRKPALVTATRLLQRQNWRAGTPPPTDGAPEEVREAAALLAADIAAKPSLGDDASSGSNVKAVGAGSARVEFFAPVAGNVLPRAIFALLSDLLGSASVADGDPSLDGASFGSHGWQRSRFDPDTDAWVDVDECSMRYRGY